ncbi:growth/differentiation factor 9 [Xyrichtys novacula]|uniref:Growth/differentiation factor 9 n=1 Tax=Xyrichtys novacula TaxID=13765 RepID=A0AAV1FBD2_XYRNO|nr:growth/differentiation factor 9 [Xyrichtys novacula]
MTIFCLFVMEKQMLMSAIFRYFRTVFLLLLLFLCCSPLVGSSLGASSSLHNLGDWTYPFGSIFSPLLKALSEHGRSKWSPDLRRKLKPEHKYIKYLTEVYKDSPRVQRSLDGSKIYNTVRLIKPQDECRAQSHRESYMQDLSYSLDQVRKKEQLLKATLLYSLDQDHASPVDSVCYLTVKEQELSDQCQLCPAARLTVNFTTSSNMRSGRNWVEADVTPFLQPLLQFKKKTIHLLINITCPEGSKARDEGRKGPPQFNLRSPLLLLYLNDTSSIAHQRLPVSAKAGHESISAANSVHKQRGLKPEQRIGWKRRWRRASPKNKRGDKSGDYHLPELLPSSEFPTSDCALYDFRVRFSQLKLDQWIVFPPKYNPRYCRGICPNTVGFIYGSPLHTVVQNLIYEKLDSSVPRPSCIPSHYSPLSVMIFEKDGSYVYKEIKDMVATRCTCR